MLALSRRSRRVAFVVLLFLSACAILLTAFSEAAWIVWRFCAALAEFVLDTRAVRVSRNVDDMAVAIAPRGRNFSAWTASAFFQLNASHIVDAGFNR